MKEEINKYMEEWMNAFKCNRMTEKISQWMN